MEPREERGSGWRRIGVPVLIWVSVWGVLVVATLGNHPTVGIAGMATAVLEGGAAAVVYGDRFWVAWMRGNGAGVAAVRLLACGLAGLLVAGMIQGIYRVFWHPDPRLFGFLFNWVADTVWVGVHLVVVLVWGWVTSRRAPG